MLRAMKRDTHHQPTDSACSRTHNQRNDAAAKLIPIYIRTRSDIQGRDLYYDPPQEVYITPNKVQDIKYSSPR